MNNYRDLDRAISYWLTRVELGERVAWHQNEEDRNPLYVITRLARMASLGDRDGWRR